MPSLDEVYRAAIAAHQAGRLAEAERFYQQILAAAPDHADSLHLLGVVEHQTGRHAEALVHLQKAIAREPGVAEFHNNFALVLHTLGRLSEAVDHYRRALAIQPHFIDALANLGSTLKAQGQLDQAVECYRRALAANPRHAAALCNLGNALRLLGRLPEAIAALRQAVEINPRMAQAWNNLGVACEDQEQVKEAAECYRQATALDASDESAYINLGRLYRRQGDRAAAGAAYLQAMKIAPKEAAAYTGLANVRQEEGLFGQAVLLYRQALALSPDQFEAYYNLGRTLERVGRVAEARATYERAVSLMPQHAQAHNNLGNAYQAEQRFEEAAQAYRQAMKLDPQNGEALVNLGTLLQRDGRLEEAIAHYRQAIATRETLPEAWTNLGNVFKEQGRISEALAAYEEALRQRPDYAEGHFNRANILFLQGRDEEAEAAYRRALALKPEHPKANRNLGHLLQEKGQVVEAAALYRLAIALDPRNPAALGQLVHHLAHLCRWDEMLPLAERLIEVVDHPTPGTLADPVSPFIFLTLPIATRSDQQRRAAEQWAARHARGTPLPPADTRPPRGKSPLVLGYLSADFRQHPVGQLMADVLESHDRSAFRIIGYSFGTDDESPLRQRLARACDEFVDIRHQSFMATAKQIRADGVDILIDLTGYTGDARTQLLALRPAPIQVNYLGYPGTLGGALADYILVDDFVVPAEDQPHFAERLVHLPGCYQANDRHREASPQTPSRDECGLPGEGFVFCSFNNIYKVTPAVFEVWMRLLKQVPGSVLWLLEGHARATQSLRQAAEDGGVDAKRLVFAPWCPAPEHLARHRLADLFLDTYPYNAHTTASESLWMGCPLVTLAGTTFPSRVAGSLLRAVGVSELITSSLEEYEALALRLARDPNWLTELRQRLEAGRDTSGLFDGRRHARALEEAYRQMWEFYSAGQGPQPFSVGKGGRSPRPAVTE